MVIWHCSTVSQSQLFWKRKTPWISWPKPARWDLCTADFAIWQIGLWDIFGLMRKSNLRIKLVFLNWTLFCLVQIILDNKDLECHATTTNEIKECCRDIRVLGRKELRLVVWNIRKKIGFVVGPKYFDRTYKRYRGIEFFSFICRLLLSWRSKLRRYLSKKLKMEAKSLQDEIK